MRIVVTDVSSVGKPTEHEFVLPLIKVGRDSERCHLVFDRVTWPMVSRYHAEFRYEDGRFVLVDVNSTFGTFVNGQRVKNSMEVRKGTLVQFGAGGPMLRIASVAYDEESLNDSSFKADRVKDVAPDLLIGGDSKSLPSSRVAWLEVNANGNNQERVELSSEITVLGRDPLSLIRFNFEGVSRRHAEVRRINHQFELVDLNSYNGTFVNGVRISSSTILHGGDEVQLGQHSPILRFISPRDSGQLEQTFGFEREQRSRPISNSSDHLEDVSKTLVAQSELDLNPQRPSVFVPGKTPPLLECDFLNKPYISVGRGPTCDIRLDSLQVSVHHARFIKDQNTVLIEDKGSTNGVFVNGKRIDRGRNKVGPQDVLQIGPFVLQISPKGSISVFDTRAKTRIDVVNLNKVVTKRAGHQLTLLDAVELSIQPNEFVGLLGPSGAGKSTLMAALNGMSAPSSGHVLVNNLDLYQHLDSLKHSIGYVPQDDIIHRELTVERTLSYVAGLRLSRDVSKEEVGEIIDEVLEVTGLIDRRDVLVQCLSGGQRKRLSIAVELITKPNIIFLDEPTSGLDPATEEKIMKLFRRIAEMGRTVVLTTHNTANVNLFDKIVVLVKGQLVFYGKPTEALEHFGVSSFKDLYDVLETPFENRIEEQSQLQPVEDPRGQIKKDSFETSAHFWRNRFQSSKLYERNIKRPLSAISPSEQASVVNRPRFPLRDGVRQWNTLVKRYTEILAHDRITLLVLLGQAPVIAFLTYLVINEQATRDFPYFMLALVASWFGTSLASREIIRERPVYKRERMVNLGVWPYVASKVFVLAVIVSVQCVLLFGSLRLLHYARLTYLPGIYFGLPQLLVMILTGLVGIGLGLLVSAVVKSSQAATSLVPLLLIPQILFSGMNGIPNGVARVTGATMPVTWSFDQMKRLSTLQTLNDEGSVAKYMESKAKGEQEKTERSLEVFNREVTSSVNDYTRRVEDYLVNVRANPRLDRPQPPTLTTSPTLTKHSDNYDLKEFVSFTHPWGGSALNWVVLFLLLFILLFATVATLRMQD
jgi:ABC transport system ATP-binding/permease protein